MIRGASSQRCRAHRWVRLVGTKGKEALEADGVLALGAVESVVGITDAFKPCPERCELYRPNPARGARAGVQLKMVAAAAG
jgi:chemotaxis protein methyltransferase CheR